MCQSETAIIILLSHLSGSMEGDVMVELLLKILCNFLNRIEASVEFPLSLKKAFHDYCQFRYVPVPVSGLN